MNKTFLATHIISYLRKAIHQTIWPFKGSKDYWGKRYERGETSGDGSYGQLAEFKAEILNRFVETHDIQKVIEFGCGDGNQLSLAAYPSYIGYDVSEKAVTICQNKFSTDSSKRFDLVEEHQTEKAELTLSLDVIFHLVEDDVFNEYMHRLFNSSTRFVIIYSSDTDDLNEPSTPHVRHRKFSSWIQQNRPEWHLIKKIPNKYPVTEGAQGESFADFYIYEQDSGDKKQSLDDFALQNGL